MAKPKLIGFDKGLEQALDGLLSSYQPELFSQIGGTIALVNHDAAPEQLLSLGYPSLRPLLLLSLLQQKTLEKVMKENAIGLKALVAQPQIMLWRLPCPKEELLLNLAAASAKTIGEENADELWQEFLSICFGREARYILHDLGHVTDASDSKFPRLQERAKAIGVDATTPEELRTRLDGFRYTPTTATQPPAQTIDLAVDVDGTLITRGQLNRAVAALIERERSAGRTVIVWTGGDPVEAKTRLAALGFPCEVAQKSSHRGVHVTLAIDDRPESLTAENITADEIRRPENLK